MWAAIRTETGGRVDTQVLAENNKIQGSDPAALKMLLDGEIQFFTLMGGILGTVVPAAEVQQVPFAFRSAAHAHQAMDGALGAYLREEMAAKGIVGFPVGAFDNGMRQITSDEAADRGSRRSRRHQDAGPGGATGGRHVQSAWRGAGHHQQQRDLRRAEERHRRCAGEPARARRSVQALRGGEVRQHDQSHVVGLQSAGEPGGLDASPRRPHGDHRSERAEARPASARGSGADEHAAARRARAPRPRVQRPPTPAPFRKQIVRRLRDVEGTARVRSAGSCSKTRAVP